MEVPLAGLVMDAANAAAREAMVIQGTVVAELWEQPRSATSR